MRNYKELACFRDIAFYQKYFLATSKSAFPNIRTWFENNAELDWEWNEDKKVYKVDVSLAERAS
jgi:hypothetical protein